MTIWDVNEWWAMRNGSIAHITHRCGGYAAGTIDGSQQIHCWYRGETEAGRGYSLVRQAQAPTLEPAAGTAVDAAPTPKDFPEN